MGVMDANELLSPFGCTVVSIFGLAETEGLRKSVKEIRSALLYGKVSKIYERVILRCVMACFPHCAVSISVISACSYFRCLTDGQLFQWKHWIYLTRL